MVVPISDIQLVHKCSCSVMEADDRRDVQRGVCRGWYSGL